MVEDREIRDIVRAAAGPRVAAEQLVDAALGAGGRDNATVVVLFVDRLPVMRSS
jgi:protein phosphatase